MKSLKTAALAGAIFCGGASGLWAEEPGLNDYSDFLIRQAVGQNLAQQRFWHLLLHYRETLFGGFESDEDGPDFFNAPKGKTDPQAEMIETLKSFFRDPASLAPGEEHPQCNFPARYKWLKTQLAFDLIKLPEQPCPRLEGWIKDLDADKVTLVFASHYLSSPASMFGHTLLRIDRMRDGTELSLLNYGVNYAANVDTDNALGYIFKGVFGLFRGTFTIFPYYTKVQLYANWEARDLWEYELNFTEDQLDYILRHLWELGGNYFDYFYFEENCSYHLLSILEVGNPELRLTDQFLFHVIPGDTIKVLTRQPGLISRQVYRPSLLSQMNGKRLMMSSRQKRLLYRMAADTSWINREDYQRLDGPEKALILDALLDYAQYRNMKEGKDILAYHNEMRDVLLERSRLSHQRQAFENPVRFSSPPDLAHGSAGIRVGAGLYEGDVFQEISYRPAYHDLLARDTGYARDSQILVLDLSLRYYNETKRVKLDSLKLLNLLSLPAYDPLFRQWSWRIGLGLDTIRDVDCGLCNSFKVDSGFGWSLRASYFSPLLLYALLNFQAEVSGHLDHDHRVGGGPTAGMLLDATDHWRLQVAGSYLNLPLGHRSDYYELSVNQRYAVAQDLDLRIGYTRISRKDEWRLSISYYF